MAAFRQRGGVWRVEICVSNIRESATFDTKSQAKIWAAKRETEIRESSKGKLPDYTLKQAVERYIAEVSPKKKSHLREVNRFNAFLRSYPKLAALPIARITTDDLVKWRDDRLKTIQGASLRRDANALSAVFNTARKEWKWIYESPMIDLSMPPQAKHRDRRISDDEIRRLTYAANWEESTPSSLTQQVLIAFLFALETAMRAGEIRKLTWDRVFLKDRYVALHETKNGTKRNVPLSKRAVELLEMMKDIDSKYVFTVNEGSFDTLWRKLRDRCEIDNLHFHDSRHEACTRLARKLEVLDLARMIGHKDLKSLMIYYNATATEIASRLD